MRGLGRAAAVLGVLGVLVAAAVAVQIVRAGSQDAPPEADVALVLGAAVWGHSPSPVFAARIDAAVDLYREGTVGAVLFTGGTRSDSEPAESVVARAYALDAGLPSADVYVENKSRTTAQNLACSLPVLRALGAESVVLVSDPLHLWRARWQARDLGLDVALAPTPYTRYRGAGPRLRFLAREVGFSFVYAAERIAGPPRCPEPLPRARGDGRLGGELVRGVDAEDARVDDPVDDRRPVGTRDHVGLDEALMVHLDHDGVPEPGRVGGGVFGAGAEPARGEPVDLDPGELPERGASRGREHLDDKVGGEGELVGERRAGGERHRAGGRCRANLHRGV